MNLSPKFKWQGLTYLNKYTEPYSHDSGIRTQGSQTQMLMGMMAQSHNIRQLLLYHQPVYV